MTTKRADQYTPNLIVGYGHASTLPKSFTGLVRHVSPTGQIIHKSLKNGQDHNETEPAVRIYSSITDYPLKEEYCLNNAYFPDEVSWLKEVAKRKKIKLGSRFEYNWNEYPFYPEDQSRPIFYPVDPTFAGDEKTADAKLGSSTKLIVRTWRTNGFDNEIPSYFTGYVIEKMNGIETYHLLKNGVLHSEVGPAVWNTEGESFYYLNGVAKTRINWIDQMNSAPKKEEKVFATTVETIRVEAHADGKLHSIMFPIPIHAFFGADKIQKIQEGNILIQNMAAAGPAINTKEFTGLLITEYNNRTDYQLYKDGKLHSAKGPAWWDTNGEYAFYQNGIRQSPPTPFKEQAIIKPAFPFEEKKSNILTDGAIKEFTRVAKEMEKEDRIAFLKKEIEALSPAFFNYLTAKTNVSRKPNHLGIMIHQLPAKFTGLVKDEFPDSVYFRWFDKGLLSNFGAPAALCFTPGKKFVFGSYAIDGKDRQEPEIFILEDVYRNMVSAIPTLEPKKVVSVGTNIFDNCYTEALKEEQQKTDNDFKRTLLTANDIKLPPNFEQDLVCAAHFKSILAGSGSFTTKDNSQMALTKTSTVTDKVLTTVKSDMHKTGYRLAANKTTKLVRGAIVEGMTTKMGLKGASKKATGTKLEEFFSSPYGEAMISLVIGSLLPLVQDKIPGNHGSKVEKLAEEFRVRGFTVVGDELVDLLTGPAMGMLSNGLKDILNTVESPAELIRVDAMAAPVPNEEAEELPGTMTAAAQATK